MVEGPWILRGAIVILALAATVPVSGGVMLRVRDGRPIVDSVYVNGHGPYRFLLDTGTNVNLIGKRLAKKIGMAPTFSEVVESSIGKTLLPGSDGNWIQLGDVVANAQRFQFSTLDNVRSTWPDVDGVLGQWFLSRFDYLLDLRNRRIEFGKREVAGNRAALRLREGRAAVSTSLGELILDSGAARLVLFGVLPETGEFRQMLTLAGSQSVGMVDSRLAIEGRDVWRGPAVAIPEREAPGIAGLMPLSLFRAVYMCNSEGYVVFE